MVEILEFLNSSRKYGFTPCLFALQAQLERMKAATGLAAVAEAQLAPASASAAMQAQRGSQAAVQDLPALQRSSSPSTASWQSAVAEQQAHPAQPQPLRVPPSMRPSRVRGLSSSMALEEGLRNHWYPAHFASVRPLPLAPLNAMPQTSIARS